MAQLGNYGYILETDAKIKEMHRKLCGKFNLKIHITHYMKWLKAKEKFLRQDLFFVSF